MLKEQETKIQKWEYRSFAGIPADLTALGVQPSPKDSEPEVPVRARERIRELETKLAALEEKAAKFPRQVEEARREGVEQGHAAEGRARTELLKQCSAGLTRAMEKFVADRDRYLGAVEHEVVRLALAIAARVLHREAHMDPLLLSGAVRVALGQLGEAAEVKLRVPEAEQDLWSEMLRLMPNLALRPELVPDDRLHAGEAVLEAHSGSVDLGVRAQLEEIERGFFDLIESREGGRHGGAPGSMAGSLTERAAGSISENIAGNPAGNRG